MKRFSATGGPRRVASRHAATFAARAVLLTAALGAGCARNESAEPSGSSHSEAISSSPTPLPFAPLSFEDALAKARSENKLVFVDVYTDWCGYCSQMDRDVFTDSRVQTALLDVVPIRVNAEKGAGRTVAARYRVSDLPTFLVVRSDGVVVHRFAGYFPPEIFLKHLGRGTAARG